MSYLAIQSVTPTQPGQTLAGITQGQNSADSVFFGALMGGFSDAQPTMPTVSALQSSEISLAQPLAQDVVMLNAPTDTLSLVASSIQTADGLSVAGQLLPTPVQTFLDSGVSQGIATPSVATPSVATPSVATPSVATQAVATQAVATQAVATQAELTNHKTIASHGDASETEFQRLSGQVTKDEGDVVISSLTGQPFFNAIPDSTAKDTAALSDPSALMIPITPQSNMISAAVAPSINLATQTMAHQAVSQPSVAVDVTQDSLLSEVSLGDEQGAPLFATYTSSAAKDSLVMSAKPFDAPINSAMTGTVGMTAATQQSAMMQQQGQSSQQQNDARADAALRAADGAKSDASVTQSDTDAFSAVLGSFSSPTSSPLVSTPFNSPVSLRQPQWTQDMGNRMQMMVSQRMKEVEVKLDPVALGPVRIHLKMDEENKAHVTLSAQHGLTRDMLENALPRLRDMLAQQGVDIGSATVDSGAQQQASEQQQQTTGQNKGADLSTDAANLISETPVWKSVDGLVDHFV